MKRTITETHEEYVNCIRNLSPAERDEIKAAMYHCAVWIDMHRRAITDCIHNVSGLLKNDNIKQHAPRIAKALDGLKIILEQVEIVKELAQEG